MSEAEYLMKNYGDRGGCWPRRITPSELIFDSARLGLFSPTHILQIGDVATSSCLLAVLAMFLAIISPSSYS